MQLSIIIPTYNSEETIQSCLDSIKDQSFQNLEVVIVDGNSSDNTLFLVENSKDLLSNLQVVSESDQGIYDAMNKGIRMAKGEWLYFLGSDDELYHSKVLEEMFSDPQVLKNDLIYGNVKIKNSGFIHRYEFDIFKLFQQNICHQAIFTRKEVFKKLGCFDVRFQQLADWDFNIRCWLEPSIKKKYVPIIVALYNNQATSSQIKDEEFLNHKNQFLKKKIFTYQNRIKRKGSQVIMNILLMVK